MSKWMLYGATGYTGTVIAEEAVRRGHRPLLAGRNADKLRPIAERLGLEWLVFSLDDKSTLRRAVRSVDLVLNAAGPFNETCLPAMEACLAEDAHYLDISNEISVLHAAQSLHQRAKENGISIIPGVGFGTIASNCLASHVCRQIENPSSLEIAISPYIAQKSAGAAKSTLETIAQGGYVRRNGACVSTPFGSGARRVRFGDGEQGVIPVPSGDLEAAHMATGVANITVYISVPLSPASARLLLPIVQKLLACNALRQQAMHMIERRYASAVTTPVDANKHSWLWAKAADSNGNHAEAWLETGEGYAFTASAGIFAVEWVLSQKPVGVATPAAAFGADFVLQVTGVRRYDKLD